MESKRGPKGPSKYTIRFIEKEAEALLHYAKASRPVPFVTEFASKRGYARQRLTEFAQASEKFSDALKRMKDIQEYKIVIGALTGKLNPTFAIFTLKNVAGWRDRKEIQPGGEMFKQIIIIDDGKVEDKLGKRLREITNQT